MANNSWRGFKYLLKRYWYFDLPAGLSVFLVALPLCLGIALASGAPVSSGLLAGIVGGLVVPWISGSPLSVSGPAAGLTTVVSSGILLFGNFQIYIWSVLIAGIMQLAIGVFRLGDLARYTPASVIKGMLAAIGILLIGKQIPLVIGLNQPDFWSDDFTRMLSSANYGWQVWENMSIEAAGIGIVSLLLLAAAENPRIKPYFPLPPFLLVVLLGLIYQFVTAKYFPEIALPANLCVSVPTDVLTQWNGIDLNMTPAWNRVLREGAILAILASLETLLCLEAVDKLDPQHRNSPVNREMIAQGAGNIICGWIGALPITAVIVRGAANVEAGAKTRLSSVTHGALLLLSVAFLVRYLNHIPYASLAAILFMTGYKLTKPAIIRSIYKQGFKQFLPFALTILMILIIDLLIGVTVGLLIAIWFVLRDSVQSEFELVHLKAKDSNSYLLSMNANVSFLNKVKLKESLESVPEHAKLDIDLSDTRFIDPEVAEVIRDFIPRAQHRHISLSWKGSEEMLSKINGR